MHVIRADDGSGNIKCSFASFDFTTFPMNCREMVASTPVSAWTWGDTTATPLAAIPEMPLLAQSPVPRARKLTYPKSMIVVYIQRNMKKRN